MIGDFEMGYHRSTSFFPRSASFANPAPPISPNPAPPNCAQSSSSDGDAIAEHLADSHADAVAILVAIFSG